MYCQFCGSQLEGKPKFCEKCGKPIGDIASQSANEINQTSANLHSSSAAQSQDNGQKDVKQPEKKAESGMSPGKNIMFWIMWSLLALLSIGMMLNEFVPIQAGLLAVLLFILILLKKKLFKKLIPSIGGWVAASIIFLVIVSMTGNYDPQRNKEIGEIQNAFEQKDVAKVAEYLHPENKDHMKAVFEQHQSELDKVGKLISTKRLIYADSNYAEYEVKDNGKKYMMIFEKVQGKWRLSRF